MIDYELYLYNKFTRIGHINAASRITVTRRHNALSTISFDLATDHYRVPELQAEGARVAYRENGGRVVEGRVVTWSASGVGDRDMVTFTAHSKFEMFSGMLGWPVPANGLDAQNVTNYVRSGRAETILKDVVRENASRQGLSLNILPDQARGDIITVDFRFQPLVEKLFPVFDQAGIGVDVWMENGTYNLDCYPCNPYPHELSETDGTISGGSYSSTGPTVTRVVVGGQGEGVEREFRQFINADLEAEWGVIIEKYQDARDSEDGGVYDARAAEILAEGAPVSGLSLQLSGAESAKIGADLRLGSIVTAEIRGQRYTDKVREIITTIGSDGYDVTPVVGERTDDPSKQLAKKLRSQSKTINDRNR